ncbi:leucyl/phenylalanyl-tRNA--protein transferase [Thalassotalea aquiviva]|uniref:leucyl/phenylalanyl-tRNA--protein transferase n=1 Tax=Thalassotalea aquiviva TaxID=3242415 RepID=UPI00352B8141
MSQILYSLNDKDLAFPHPEHALQEPNGLLAIGGDLSSARLIRAYRQGIFPWYSDHDPILWWSPDPRAIIYCQQIRVNKTLKKFVKKSPYHITINQAFEQVINNCSDAPFRNDDTWILPEMLNAYLELHKLGIAHSIEVWEQGHLVGGLYGVAINGAFSGESMFYRKPNASKIALLALCQHLQTINIELIDCQLQNPFLQSMGAIEISRADYLKHLNKLVQQAIDDDFWCPKELQLNYG